MIWLASVSPALVYLRLRDVLTDLQISPRLFLNYVSRYPGFECLRIDHNRYALLDSANSCRL